MDHALAPGWRPISASSSTSHRGWTRASSFRWTTYSAPRAKAISVPYTAGCSDMENSTPWWLFPRTSVQNGANDSGGTWNGTTAGRSTITNSDVHEGVTVLERLPQETAAGRGPP